MTELVIRAGGLRKSYRVIERDAGVRAALKNLVRREVRTVTAVDGITFAIEAGEVVGFLGPNGAGKSTTLKMLAGLLHPTAGELAVLGHLPWKRKREYLTRIAMVMGNRNQLNWDIPAIDSYEVNRSIYQIPAARFRSTLAELIELMDIGDLVRKPVRTLSLGERMKAEIVGSLLHVPQVLFLDEPTLGLDVTAQRRLRRFVAEYNARHGATVLLTSHYMADVQALCDRVIVIDKGTLRYDGPLSALAGRVMTHRELVLTLAGPVPDFSRYGDVLAVDGNTVRLRVPRDEAAAVTAQVLARHGLTEFSSVDPSMEEVIELLFAVGVRS
ncbi:ABC-type uncharacterized transport system, ATPase component [Saccharomonospora marina XMU15]|uniref:ABC-type uncharacterized transport system, ATPase component n=1 Tax=Saccharomonospora marina XMU15 TaxID=882083 RepID=H5X6Y7_9PSEU|nr:ATP-binding cassette domain-containing protein [Saccharomonospora marina]EHR52417.1 ABC-type uncharacterized transport system, ATPase component [Saccharomonospora marina XMU15]